PASSRDSLHRRGFDANDLCGRGRRAAPAAPLRHAGGIAVHASTPAAPGRGQAGGARRAASGAADPGGTLGIAGLAAALAGTARPAPATPDGRVEASPGRSAAIDGLAAYRGRERAHLEPA